MLTGTDQICAGFFYVCSETALKTSFASQKFHKYIRKIPFSAIMPAKKRFSKKSFTKSSQSPFAFFAPQTII